MTTVGWKFLGAFLIGSLLMIVLAFTVYRRSYYYQKARAEAGIGPEKPGLRSRVVTLLLLLAMILFFVLVDLWLLPDAPATFWFLAAFNLALIALISMFDALFIDYYLLLVARPAVLRLPEGQPTREAMKRHVRLQFTKGWFFKIPIALLAAAVAGFADHPI